MSHPKIYVPWRVEADTLPDMEYDSYRHALIHETTDIRDFLAAKHSSRTILVAPKGYGKTLLLIAKKKAYLEAKSGVIMAQNLYIDRPSGTFPRIRQELVESLANDYDFWKSLWKVCIAIAAIKAFSKNTKDSAASKLIINHDWYTRILNDDSKFFDAGELFTDLMAHQHSYVLSVLQRSQTIFPFLNRINTSVVFFIDNVDEYFVPILEDRSRTTNFNSIYRNRNNMIWALAQIALASVAYELEKINPHLKIFCTMRHEAYLRMPEVENDAYQISSRCIQIKYTPQDLEKIFIKNIDITTEDRLVTPKAADPLARFVGDENKDITHRFVSKSQRVFDFFLRHSLYRPRDLMYIGGEIAKIDPCGRTEAAIQDAVDGATKAIISSIFAEMRPFFAVPSRSRLFKHIFSNALSKEQLGTITKNYLSEYKDGATAPPDDESNHPFCVLYKLGLLGIIRLEHGRNEVWRQNFIQPTDIRMSNDTGLPHSKYYLLHPALDQSVYEQSSGRFTRLYHRQNIIGNRLSWEEPITHSFVLKGDVVGYSKVMDSELYEIATRKLYEWAVETCGDLYYVDVSGGDSILLIDDSPTKLFQRAQQLARLASDFRDHPMQIRFGGAAGPVSYERVSRMHDGTWDEMIVPMGLAL